MFMCILATFWSRTYHWIQNNLSSPSILFRFDHLFVTLSNPTPPAHTDGQHRPPPGGWRHGTLPQVNGADVSLDP